MIPRLDRGRFLQINTLRGTYSKEYMVFPFGRICNSVNTVSLFTQTSEVCGGEQVEPPWCKILPEGVFQFLKIISFSYQWQWAFPVTRFDYIHLK